MTILKQGIDSRIDGIVWMMREATKLGVFITEDKLPEYVDGQTKQFILRKFIIYSTVMDLKDQNDFMLSFYKMMIGKNTAMDQIA